MPFNKLAHDGQVFKEKFTLDRVRESFDLGPEDAVIYQAKQKGIILTPESRLTFNQAQKLTTPAFRRSGGLDRAADKLTIFVRTSSSQPSDEWAKDNPDQAQFKGRNAIQNQANAVFDAMARGQLAGGRRKVEEWVEGRSDSELNRIVKSKSVDNQMVRMAQQTLDSRQGVGTSLGEERSAKDKQYAIEKSHYDALSSIRDKRLDGRPVSELPDGISPDAIIVDDALSGAKVIEWNDALYLVINEKGFVEEVNSRRKAMISHNKTVADWKDSNPDKIAFKGPDAATKQANAVFDAMVRGKLTGGRKRVEEWFKELSEDDLRAIAQNDNLYSDVTKYANENLGQRRGPTVVASSLDKAPAKDEKKSRTKSANTPDKEKRGYPPSEPFKPSRMTAKERAAVRDEVGRQAIFQAAGHPVHDNPSLTQSPKFLELWHRKNQIRDEKTRVANKYQEVQAQAERSPSDAAEKRAEAWRDYHIKLETAEEKNRQAMNDAREAHWETGKDKKGVKTVAFKSGKGMVKEPATPDAPAKGRSRRSTGADSKRGGGTKGVNVKIG